MSSKSKALPSLLVLLFITSIFVMPPTTVDASVIQESKYFPLTDENSTIILSNGTSYLQSNYYPAHNSTTGLFIPESWDFVGLSTGNGDVDLTVSALNCNVTMTSFDVYTQNTTEKYLVNDFTWLNYTVKGVGNQTLDYSALHNSNDSNPIVYIEGTARQQGDGWNWANFGITVYGARSNVSINQENNVYNPPRYPLPRGPSLLNTLAIFGSITLVTGAIAIVLLHRRHRKTTNLNQ